ncbi:MAG: hypothetical protein JXA77_19290 [Bacteroidales bacterium]|nr:hypothetical protein [Bacteroidales bacterium]MBN2818960.1 hypothetical protein [Bacteroidales bacterium]
MKRVFCIVLTILSFTLKAQSDEVFAANSKINHSEYSYTSDSSKIRLFSNSEPQGISFIVNSNIKAHSLLIETNFKGKYRIQFVDYWGNTIRIIDNAYKNQEIDVTDFKDYILTMNITDALSQKLLTSQVLNLKRRNY